MKGTVHEKDPNDISKQAYLRETCRSFKLENYRKLKKNEQLEYLETYCKTISTTLLVYSKKHVQQYIASNATISELEKNGHFEILDELQRIG